MECLAISREVPFILAIFVNMIYILRVVYIGLYFKLHLTREM